MKLRGLAPADEILANVQLVTEDLEPIDATTSGDVTQVRTRVSGDFPGSPVNLRYQFVLDGNKIAGLEITL